MPEYNDMEIIASVREMLASHQSITRASAIRACLQAAGYEPNRSNQRRVEMKMSKSDDTGANLFVFDGHSVVLMVEASYPDWYRVLCEECVDDAQYDQGRGFGATMCYGLTASNDPVFEARYRYHDKCYLVMADDGNGGLFEILIKTPGDWLLFQASYMAPILQLHALNNPIHASRVAKENADFVSRHNKELIRELLNNSQDTN
jgi:hypothetical protein